MWVINYPHRKLTFEIEFKKKKKVECKAFGRECVYDIGVRNHFLKKRITNPQTIKETINLPNLRLKLLFKKRHNKPSKKTSHRLFPQYTMTPTNKEKATSRIMSKGYRLEIHKWHPNVQWT